MPEMEEYYNALRNADAAGDTEAAKKISDFIRSQQQGVNPATQTNVTYSDPETGDFFEAPVGTPPEKANYLNDIQNKMRNPGDFFGYVNAGLGKAGQLLTAPGRGAVGTAANIYATLESGSRRELGDIMQTELSKEEYGLMDYLNMTPRFWTVADDVARKVAWERLTGDEKELMNMRVKAQRYVDGAARLREKNARFIEKNVPRPEGVEGVFYDIGGVFTTVGASIGLSYATRNPLSAAALFGKIQGSDVYNEARDAGTEPAKARALASLAGITEGALEFIGVNQFMKYGKVDKGLRLITKRAVEESLQEGSQELASELIRQGSGIKEIDVVGALQDIAYSMFLGGIGGGGTAATMEAGKALTEEKGLPPETVEMLRAKVEEKQGEFDDRIGEVIEQEASETFSDKKANKQVAKILNKFFTGEKIDIKEELQSIEHMSESEKSAIFDMVDEIEVSRVAQEQAAKTGRMRKIDADIRQLDNTVEQLSNLVNERAAEGKAVDAINKRIDKELEKREALEQERSDLEELGIPQDDSGLVTVRPEALEQGEKIDREKARSFRQGFRKGQQLFAKDGKAARKAIVEAIKQAGLTPKQTGAFLTAVANIQTAEQAAKALPLINSRISNILEKTNKKKINKAIKRVLKAGKPTKSGKKPVGKLGDANLQSFVNKLNSYTKLTQEEAGEKFADMLRREEITPENELEIQLLASIANPTSVSVEQLAETLEEISSLVYEGRQAEKTKRTERREKNARTREVLTDAATYGRDVENMDGTKKREIVSAAFREIGSFESAWSNGWYDTLDILLGKTKEGRALRDDLAKRVHTGIQKSKALNGQWGDRFVELAKEAFGLEKQKHIHRKFMEDEKPVVLGWFAREGQDVAEDAEPLKPKKWTLSKTEMRKLWMELQDPTIRPSLISRDGNGITEEMENVLDEQLTAEDKVFARSQMELYKEMYPEVNQVYAAIYGANLPDNPFYSPIRAKYDRIIAPADEFLQEVHMRATATPGFTKERVKGVREIKPQSDVAAMLRHITQASHFISMAETSRDLQSIFGSSEVAETIQTVWGNTMLGSIDSYIKDFTRGEAQRSEAVFRWGNWLNSNFTVAVLALKPNLMFKQMTSAITFAADIPAGEYAAGIRDFVTNFDEAMDIMRSSPLMKARGANQDVDIARGAQRAVHSLRGRKARLDEIILLPTRLGDRGAIYVGGWSVYRYHRKVLGKSHEEAMAEFEYSVAMSQQSSDLDQKSRIQASDNFLVRGIAMFMSAPNAYYRASKRAIRQRIRGEIGNKEFTKKMMIYNVMLPIFFQWVSGAFAWDDDDNEDGWMPWVPKDIERALVTGWIDGLFVIGPMWEKAYAYKQGIYWPNAKANFEAGVSEIFDFMVDVMKEEDGIDMWTDLIEGLGLIAGLPTKSVGNIIGGVEDIAEGDTEVGVKRVLGYTKKTAEKSSE